MCLIGGEDSAEKFLILANEKANTAPFRPYEGLCNNLTKSYWGVHSADDCCLRALEGYTDE